MSRGRPLSSGIHRTTLLDPLMFLDEGKHTKHPKSLGSEKSKRLGLKVIEITSVVFRLWMIYGFYLNDYGRN